MLSKKPKLQDMLKTTQRDVHTLESHLLLASSQMSRLHGALQNALSTATYLTQLVTPCHKVGIDISASVRFESAKVLWGQGEMTASINMLQDLNNAPGSHNQLVEVGKSELLATLVSGCRQGLCCLHADCFIRDIKSLRLDSKNQTR